MSSSSRYPNLSDPSVDKNYLNRNGFEGEQNSWIPTLALINDIIHLRICILLLHITHKISVGAVIVIIPNCKIKS